VATQRPLVQLQLPGLDDEQRRELTHELVELERQIEEVEVAVRGEITERVRAQQAAVRESLRKLHAVLNAARRDLEERHAEIKARRHAEAQLLVEHGLLAQKRRSLGRSDPTLAETLEVIKRRGFSTANPLATRRG
jgi:hypothetical protein